MVRLCLYDTGELGYFLVGEGLGGGEKGEKGGEGGRRETQTPGKTRS